MFQNLIDMIYEVSDTIRYFIGMELKADSKEELFKKSLKYGLDVFEIQPNGETHQNGHVSGYSIRAFSKKLNTSTINFHFRRDLVPSPGPHDYIMWAANDGAYKMLSKMNLKCEIEKKIPGSHIIEIKNEYHEFGQ